MSWDARLSRAIPLKRGEGRFQTLREAATFLQSRYSKARSGALAAAVSDLMAAAEAPSASNIGRATDQFSTFLAQEGLVEGHDWRAKPSTDIEARIRAMLAGKPTSAAAKAVKKVARSAGKKKPTKR